jgi:hypothetical protein
MVVATPIRVGCSREGAARQLDGTIVPAPVTPNLGDETGTTSVKALIFH